MTESTGSNESSAGPIPKRRHTEPLGISPAAMEPVISRDVNRWNLYPPPGVAPEPAVRRPASKASSFVPILIGFCAGAAGSAVVFHERVVQILALFAR